MTTKELIAQAMSLPVEERAAVIDSLLRSLNAPHEEIDQEWAALSKRRLAELRTGEVKPIPAGDVLAKVRERFSG